MIIYVYLLLNIFIIVLIIIIIVISVSSVENSNASLNSLSAVNADKTFTVYFICQKNNKKKTNEKKIRTRLTFLKKKVLPNHGTIIRTGITCKKIAQ